MAPGKAVQTESEGQTAAYFCCLPRLYPIERSSSVFLRLLVPDEHLSKHNPVRAALDDPYSNVVKRRIQYISAMTIA